MPLRVTFPTRFDSACESNGEAGVCYCGHTCTYIYIQKGIHFSNQHENGLVVSLLILFPRPSQSGLVVRTQVVAVREREIIVKGLMAAFQTGERGSELHGSSVWVSLPTLLALFFFSFPACLCWWVSGWKEWQKLARFSGSGGLIELANEAVRI